MYGSKTMTMGLPGDPSWPAGTAAIPGSGAHMGAARAAAGAVGIRVGASAGTMVVGNGVLALSEGADAGRTVAAGCVPGEDRRVGVACGVPVGAGVLAEQATSHTIKSSHQAAEYFRVRCMLIGYTAMDPKWFPRG
jgi:hypothetical protein